MGREKRNYPRVVLVDALLRRNHPAESGTCLMGGRVDVGRKVGSLDRSTLVSQTNRMATRYRLGERTVDIYSRDVYTLQIYNPEYSHG